MLDHPFFKTSLDYLKGVGPQRAELLASELGLRTFGDLLEHYPIRYDDRTQVYTIESAKRSQGSVQLQGTITDVAEVGRGPKKRLVARLEDETGSIDLVWFKGAKWIKNKLKLDTPYIVHGKVTRFKTAFNITHPELRLVGASDSKLESTLTPGYSSTEKLTKKGLDSKGLRKLTENLYRQLKPDYFEEILPESVVQSQGLFAPYETYRSVHFPSDQQRLNAARRRLKFEELLMVQLHLLSSQIQRNRSIKGHIFEKVGDKFNDYYTHHLGFELTGAQKRVVKEIRHDLKKGHQMNRLLQGDVGSGKTMVALLTMLLALDNGYQALLIAPTEILAQQHFESMKPQMKKIGITVGFLSGSVKGKVREELFRLLKMGEVHILIGTHAILEDPVEFNNLGLAVIDEQHRFGVAQRARIWQKGRDLPPHVLIMTATPIPRTLSMTLYGDLDVSVIDELPPGRKPVRTVHKTEVNRPEVIKFMKSEIAKGRQIYIVYPLIEESQALDLQDLNNGYEEMQAYFPHEEYQISVVHGRMKAQDKDFEMQRFVQGKTQIMVATTVIEVGVNVPNASVMIIENAERFGLSQLHQLRGRVGRGAEQSFCVLMTKRNLSADARKRIKTMCATNDGFKIAEVDMELRGPGDMQGTQQSGLPSFKIANIVEDGTLIAQTREVAKALLEDDPALQKPEHFLLRKHLQGQFKAAKFWSRIS